MFSPAIPTNQPVPVTPIEATQVSNPHFQVEYHQLTSIAAVTCNVPVAILSFVGEKDARVIASSGIEENDHEKLLSLSKEITEKSSDFLEIQNINHNDCLAKEILPSRENQPLIFYASVLIYDAKEKKTGILIVADIRPRKLEETQKEVLQKLAKQAENLLELQRQNEELQIIKQDLEQQNSFLKDFAGLVSHDLKTPLSNLIVTTDILKGKYGTLLGPEGNKYLQNLKQSGLKMSEYITGLLLHYESDLLTKTGNQDIELHQLLEEIVDLLNITEDVEIHFPEENIPLTSNRWALEQIFINLLSNSIKYNDKEKIIIDIDFSQNEEFYLFSIKDNGIGIPEGKQEEIFKIFTILAKTDRKGNKGNGIGLSTVKRLVTNLGGSIEVKSNPDQGTSFLFSVKRNF